MTSWHERGACRGEPQHLWFEDAGVNPEAAKAFCEICEVRAECLEFALTTGQEHGIWGGLTSEERRGQRRYRVIFCTQCGRRFTWKPAEWTPPPRFCSSACRNAARLATRQRSYYKRNKESA